MSVKKPVVIENGRYTELQAGDTIEGAAGAITVEQSLHGFAEGDVLRLNLAGVYVKAKADSPANVEAVGIVSAVHTNSIFSLSTGGFVTFPTKDDLSPGAVYFLDWTTAGLLTVSEPPIGVISKPMFIASSTNSGFLFNFRGVEVTTTTSGANLTESYLPDFPFSTLNTDGTNNNILLNTENSGSPDWENFYSAVSPESSLQDIELVTAWKINSRLMAWQTSAITITFSTDTTNTADQKLDMYIYKPGITSPLLSVTNLVSTQAGVKSSYSVNKGVVENYLAAGDAVLVVFKFYAKSSNTVKLFSVDFNYVSYSLFTGAPDSASYISIDNNTGLTNERYLAVDTDKMSITDGGIKNNVTLSVNDSVLPPGRRLFGFNNLRVETTTSSVVTVGYDNLILWNGTISMEARDYSGGADLGASGVNGLDTGSRTNNTWYYLWAIYNPATQTKALLFSASYTAPSMPSGYTFKALISAVRNTTANFIWYTQYGNMVCYQSMQTALYRGQATSPTVVPVSGVIPTAIVSVGRFMIRAEPIDVGQYSGVGRLCPTSGSGGILTAWARYENVAYDYIIDTVHGECTIVGNNVWYYVDTNLMGFSIYATGFRLNF